jgi:N-acetyl-anhydromuramoyl-L-alanine amidase
MPAATDRVPGWAGGWWWFARRRPSPNHGPRPAGTAVTLAIVHSISLPPGVYGGPGIEDLFRNRLDPDAHPYYAALRGLRVSSHFVIRRDGDVQQYVATDRRAWHAGVSSWRGRNDCNSWSIGIELEGLEGESFEPAQLAALARLLRALRRRHPLAEVVGHEHVAPGRKCDPGPGFAWPALRAALRGRHPWLVGDDPVVARAAGAKGAPTQDRRGPRRGAPRPCWRPRRGAGGHRGKHGAVHYR